MDMENETEDIPKQEDLTITEEMVKKAAKKMKNWKAAGKDGVQEYWLKTSQASMHNSLSSFSLS